MFPHPTPAARRPCARCGTQTRVDRMIHGFGSECASLLGLITATPRLRTDPQTGPNLLDQLPDPEPEDHCDGYDR